jgi:hypothetical protein
MVAAVGNEAMDVTKGHTAVAPHDRRGYEDPSGMRPASEQASAI